MQRCQRCVGSNGPISTIMPCYFRSAAVKVMALVPLPTARGQRYPGIWQRRFCTALLDERLCALLCGFHCTARCSSGKFLYCRLVQGSGCEGDFLQQEGRRNLCMVDTEYNSNKSPTRCNNFAVYYPDVYLQLNMFRAFSRSSSGAQ